MTGAGGAQDDSGQAAAGRDGFVSGEGGAIPDAAGEPAYFWHAREPAPLPILIAVPHAGREYPAALIRRMRVPGETALRLEDRLVDLVAEAVARETGASLLIAHAPRAVIDLNRATEDIDWDMVTGGAPSGAARMGAGRRARGGLGLVPRRLPGVGELWRQRMSAAELAGRIEQVHRPYHHQLGLMLEHLRDRWGSALLIDLHSMPPLGPPLGPPSGPQSGSDAPAQYVVGDRFGAACDGALVGAALDHFARERLIAAHNRPYAGGYVLDRHGVPARGMNAIQLEICRAAYLDGRLRELGAGFDRTVSAVAGLVRRLASELAANPGHFRQAAQ